MNTVINYGDLLTVSKGKIAYSQDWILNIGFTLHVSSKKEYFVSFRSSNGGIVSIANGSANKIVGFGTMKIKILDGMVCNLGGVAYV